MRADPPKCSQRAEETTKEQERRRRKEDLDRDRLELEKQRKQLEDYIQEGSEELRLCLASSQCWPKA